MKAIKMIPYIVLVIGIVLTGYSSLTQVGYENTCNKHWMDQIDVYKEEVKRICPLGLASEPVWINSSKEIFE